MPKKIKTKKRRPIHLHSPLKGAKGTQRRKGCRPSQQELSIYCRQAANTFNRFEEEYEKKFKHTLRQENADIERKLVKMFKTPFTPTQYRPEDDYYTYINYTWLANKSKEIEKDQKYYVQVDSFRMIQEKVYYELIDIIKEYIAKNHNPRANAIRNLYTSLCNLDEKAASDYVPWAIQRVDEIIASDNVYRLFAEVNQNEVIAWGCPIVWTVLKDEKNVNVYRSYLSPPQLSVYDYTIYIDDPSESRETIAYKREFKREYLHYITRIFDACMGDTSHGHSAQDVWDCEFDMLTAMGCNSVKENMEGYNVVSGAEAMRKCGFDWPNLAQQIGYKENQVPDNFICTNVNYLNCLMNLMMGTVDTQLTGSTGGGGSRGEGKSKEGTPAWKTKKWRTYYLYIVFRQLIRFHAKWRFIHYEFHEKFVKGQPAPWPKEIYPVFGMSLCFNTFLSNEYIDRNKKQQTIDYVHNMAQDLLTVYKRIIKRNSWLSPSTKRYALLKLNHINLTVGSPKLMRSDPLLRYKSVGAYQNLKKIAMWRTKKLIELDGKSTEYDIPVIDWEQMKLVGKQSYVVNAYYTPTENSIYVPLAYLQKPFIDLDERGIEYNLAHIGYTLSHEMSHCLDDLGSKYDHRGNLHNWWTAHDRQTFNRKVKNVIEQYEKFAMYDGIKMDASLSTGENLADISGLAICEEYLRDFQDKNDDIVPIRALSFHAFFTYFAVQARQKIYERAIKAQLKTNPHPMDKYRTNCPLARLKLFRSLYNVRPKDKMYWASDDTIW